MTDAIRWKLRTGASWRDLPERYGPWKTAHERLRWWTEDDSVGDVEWVISVDSSVVRVPQHSAGARKRGLRSRTQIHLAVDGRGLPMRVLLTAGQAGDNPQLPPLLDGGSAC